MKHITNKRIAGKKKKSKEGQSESTMVKKGFSYTFLVRKEVLLLGLEENLGNTFN